MNKRRLERITGNYWHVSRALRDPDSSNVVTAEEALKALNSSDRLRPEEWRLQELMHVLRYDVIENSTSWRPTRKLNGTVLKLSRS